MRAEDHSAFCRRLYPKHMEFIRAGARRWRERCFMAGNQIGKTQLIAYEVSAHATGQYPHWWDGHRFQIEGLGGLKMWVAGDTMQTTRDIVQTALFGPAENLRQGILRGGMIPADCIEDFTRKAGGVQFCLDQVWIRHVERVHGAPVFTEIGMKSYDQGRDAFQGKRKHLIWLDEEPPAPPADSKSGETNDIYSECVTRLMTTLGHLLMSYTPLRGVTPFNDYYIRKALMIDWLIDWNLPYSERERPAWEVMWGGGAG